MKKAYILALTAMAVTVMASAEVKQDTSEHRVVKYMKVGAPTRSNIRPAEDLTGATADSLIVFVGGEYDGELIKNGYAEQMQVFERSKDVSVVNNFEMAGDEWKSLTCVETEILGEGHQMTTHYYNNRGGDLVPFYREEVIKKEGVEMIETSTYHGSDWWRTQYYQMIELEGYMRTEEYWNYDPDGRIHIASKVFFDEKGQVMEQRYDVSDGINPENNRFRTLTGSYNEDGTIHTLQDEYTKIVTEINPETGKEHVCLYERDDVADAFELVTEVIETENSTIEKNYDENQLSSEVEMAYLTSPDYTGSIYQTTELTYDIETGEVVFGNREQYYYPQPDNTELIEKVVTYDWLENKEKGKGSWAWDYTFDYKYVDGYLYQVQQHGPLIIGYDSTDYVFGYTQYYYDELITGISTLSNDKTEAKQSFDLMGRRIADKVRGLSISNGKVILNR